LEQPAVEVLTNPLRFLVIILDMEPMQIRQQFLLLQALAPAGAAGMVAVRQRLLAIIEMVAQVLLDLSLSVFRPEHPSAHALIGPQLLGQLQRGQLFLHTEHMDLLRGAFPQPYQRELPSIQAPALSQVHLPWQLHITVITSLQPTLTALSIGVLGGRW
jgi:hypothetical protein